MDGRAFDQYMQAPGLIPSNTKKRKGRRECLKRSGLRTLRWKGPGKAFPSFCHPGTWRPLTKAIIKGALCKMWHMLENPELGRLYT